MHFTFLGSPLNLTPNPNLNLFSFLSREDFVSEYTGMINAKAQGLKAAKSLFRTGVFASWRLCVEMSFLSVKSVKSVVKSHWLRFRLAGPFAPFRGNSIAFHQAASSVLSEKAGEQSGE